jgi:hypothetical protein
VVGSLALLVGCGKSGPPLGKVTGVVTYDGKPLVGAAIVFSPKSDAVDAGNSWGKTDESGRYSLRFGRSRVGAYIGEHKVVIEHPTRTDRSLSATVRESSNDINFNLERPKKGEAREPRDIRDSAVDAPITAK